MIRRLPVSVLLAGALLASSLAQARTVPVKYIGHVDLGTYQCVPVTRSSFIRELCHDGYQEQAVVQLNSTWYQYCGISASEMNAWLSAPSMGRYFNSYVKKKKRC